MTATGNYSEIIMLAQIDGNVVGGVATRGLNISLQSQTTYSNNLPLATILYLAVLET